MSNLRRVSSAEKMALMKTLEQQIQESRVSSEINSSILHDRAGNPHSVGYNIKDILLDANQTPHVINENHLQVLDCGHTIDPRSGNFVMCDFGHKLCHRHNLFRCADCKALVCEIEAIEEDGRLLCPNCGSSPMSNGMLIFLIVVVIVAMIVVINLAA
ncbi:MAG: hypothetical protein R3F48_12740 [Candidatus Zixiibacteriota bacterium]